jgi:hypothetical protein
MKIRCLFFTSILLYSCGMNKKNPVNHLVPIQMQFQVHKPYCGGARPTPEMEKGELIPLSNQIFCMKLGNNDSYFFCELETNDEGFISPIEIKPGTYELYREQKSQSFESFKEYYRTTDTLFQYIGDKDAKIEFEKPDFILSVEKDSTFNFVVQSKCYVGLNPLIKYIGPKVR